MKFIQQRYLWPIFPLLKRLLPRTIASPSVAPPLAAANAPKPERLAAADEVTRLEAQAKEAGSVEFVDAMVLMYDQDTLNDESTVGSHGLTESTTVMLSMGQDPERGRKTRQEREARERRASQRKATPWALLLVISVAVHQLGWWFFYCDLGLWCGLLSCAVLLLGVRGFDRVEGHSFYWKVYHDENMWQEKKYREEWQQEKERCKAEGKKEPVEGAERGGAFFLAYILVFLFPFVYFATGLSASCSCWQVVVGGCPANQAAHMAGSDEGSGSDDGNDVQSWTDEDRWTDDDRWQRCAMSCGYSSVQIR